jgi:hypothetical protein
MQNNVEMESSFSLSMSYHYEYCVDRLFSTGVNSCAMKYSSMLKTVMVLLGYLIPQHLNFCKRNFRTPAWVYNVISLHGS